MAKAINWPGKFRQEILAEGTDSLHCAFRLGTLYYEGRYWVDGDVVDIRCNHLKIRRAVIQGDLKTCAVGEVTADDLAKQKSTLRSHAAIIDFLKETYRQPVDETTQLTVVYYKNLPVCSDEVESETDTSGRHF